MDADIPGLRAFVAAADEMHFGRAAARLFLTQQALSKRVRRLEEALGVPLFERTTRRVELTGAGARLLPLARAALTAFDAAVGAVREPARLRVDVYDERFSPIRLLRAALDRDPALRIEPSMRQGLARALPALRGGEIDAAFGQAHDLPGRPAGIDCRLVHLEPMHAYVGEDHPLAESGELRPADLPGVVMPDPGEGAVESTAFLTRLAGHFGVPIRFVEPAVGQRHYAELVARERTAVALGEAGIPIPPGSGLRRIRLVDPVPLAPWCVLWRAGDGSPALRRLLALLPVPAPPDAASWAPAGYVT
ncbi:LysR family transcriptional regulator [Actinomadura macrotermitis]|uniref:LysR family transcriptional regulator n=1 Tax=Actinomadura macrotermitis TaxID=2585200 RepID=UPI002E254833